MKKAEREQHRKYQAELADRALQWDRRARRRVIIQCVLAAALIAAGVAVMLLKA